MNPLAGKPLRYLIGANSVGKGKAGEITVVPYNDGRVRNGISVGYCNLFSERGRVKAYAPYLNTSDTARDYNEGQIDPRGQGWRRNLNDQFALRQDQGFEYIELDNPDAYSVEDVIGAIELAGSYGLKVLAKNPGLIGRGETKYTAHPNVYGAIVEKDAGSADLMDRLRKDVGKPDLPIWFVSFGRAGKVWASKIARVAKDYLNMGVTWSSRGEYTDSIDVLKPRS